MTPQQKLKQVHSLLQLKFKDKKLVFGWGVPDAKIVFVSETAPLESVQHGQPLNPDHQKLIDRLLKASGINKKTVYITNAIKYYPGIIHAVSPKEIKVHASYLKEELKTISPKIVVTMGNLALNSVGLRQPLDNVHGRTFNMGSYELLPTFHPEHAMRDASVKLLLEADFMKLKELLKANES